MQQDHYSQMKELASEIADLLQKLLPKIGAFIFLSLRALQDLRKKMIELEDARLENSALRERLEEFESWAYWDGEDIQSWADDRDRRR